MMRDGVGSEYAGTCGYAVTGSESAPNTHDWIDSRRSFWFSLLYALLEGLSGAPDVERQDINGCLYTPVGSPDSRVLVRFDDVPGGVGHVGILLGNVSYTLTSRNHIGVHSPYYGARDDDASGNGYLRYDRNQIWRDGLKRGMVIEFLRRVLS